MTWNVSTASDEMVPFTAPSPARLAHALLFLRRLQHRAIEGRDLLEVAIEAQQMPAAIERSGGNPDIVDRNWGARSPQIGEQSPITACNHRCDGQNSDEGLGKELGKERPIFAL